MKIAILEYVKGMRKVFIAMVVSLILLLSLMSPSLAAVEKSVTAEVSISTVINFTIIDYGSAGLKFGSLIPGSEDNPEVDQGESGAVLLQLGADSNVDCFISTKASNFINGANELPVNNVIWNTDNDAGGASVMKDSYSIIKTLEPGQSQSVWHWLNVPIDTAHGVYSADFFYQAAKVT